MLYWAPDSKGSPLPHRAHWPLEMSDMDDLDGGPRLEDCGEDFTIDLR